MSFIRNGFTKLKKYHIGGYECCPGVVPVARPSWTSDMNSVRSMEMLTEIKKYYNIALKLEVSQHGFAVCQKYWVDNIADSPIDFGDAGNFLPYLTPYTEEFKKVKHKPEELMNYLNLLKYYKRKEKY